MAYFVYTGNLASFKQEFIGYQLLRCGTLQQGFLSILPKFNFDFPPYNPVYICILGFSFDLKSTKNYKVVKAVSFWVEEGWLNCAELYTLHSDSWRVLPDVDQLQDLHISYYKPSSKYTNDRVFHWHLYLNIEEDEVETVLSFDMGEGVFRVTLLPRKYNACKMVPCIRRRDCNLILLKDLLAVICSFFEEGHTRFEVWMMKDYKVEESWSLELSLQPHPGLWTWVFGITMSF
ncbi:hypothetical protein CsSME_00020823 [Camellia sinensis var. sinensis]